MLQFLTISLSVSLVGGILKPLRFNPLLSSIPDCFATRFANYGMLLVLMPICWLFWAVFATNRPTTEYRTEPRAFYPIGYGILALALALGILGTVSAHSLLESLVY